MPENDPIFTRRNALKTAAWSLPVVAIAVTSPAAAASDLPFDGVLQPLGFVGTVPDTFGDYHSTAPQGVRITWTGGNLPLGTVITVLLANTSTPSSDARVNYIQSGTYGGFTYAPFGSGFTLTVTGPTGAGQMLDYLFQFSPVGDDGAAAYAAILSWGLAPNESESFEVIASSPSTTSGTSALVITRNS